MFMPLARFAQYEHCIMRRNGVRTRWMNHIGETSDMPLADRLAAIRDQWLKGKVDPDQLA